MSGEPQATLDAQETVDERGAHRRRRWSGRPVLLAGLAGGLAVVVAAAVVVVTADDVPERVSSPSPDTGAPPVVSWLSGASGEGVAVGDFATWRGDPLTIAGTWADNNQGMVELPQLQPGGEFGSWNESLDIAIGAIDEGETWAEAAGGTYDGRWRQSLTNLRQLWGDRDGTLFIRFAHELNGNWYPWSVNADNHGDFIVAWQRFRALQQEIFPESQLVFCVNRESVGNGMDWREAFPGAEYVDVIGVDYYNNFPYVDDQAGWDQTADDVDGHGAPKGIEEHLEFARSAGLPLAVPEWSGNALEGDSPAFMEAMNAFLQENAGDGPGEVLYDVLFNVDGYDGKFILYPETLMPESAAAYQRLW
ncbi:glycosyl hydrolase [Geodermatophilus sp. SYSU D01106]